MGSLRDVVRKAALQLFYGLLVDRFPYFANEILDSALLPFLKNIHREKDNSILQMTDRGGPYGRAVPSGKEALWIKIAPSGASPGGM